MAKIWFPNCICFGPKNRDRLTALRTEKGKAQALTVIAEQLF
uniref:Uncharacterized protein n=1 Tax=uncultured marine microorganism HF4000_APKG8K5 TaxID=455555 RepID=B3TB30_9ZZZZ|nr:hypothetical protein ALOHA_HF4000APKG8K5ctg1g8 [uncultured marine microorganism HF4000_APKG8K5]